MLNFRERFPNSDKWLALISKHKLRSAIGLVLVALVVIPVVTYAYFVRDISNRDRLMNRNNTGIVLLDKNGETIYSYGRVKHANGLKLADISDHAEKALIASEDAEFYKHKGYSTRGILAAIYANILNKDPTRYGGSTITQQLVKNNLLSAEKNFLRKYQELSMAIAVERHYTKDEILEMYLNSVYFGEGAFGIEDAAKVYYGKSASELNLAESSMLIGILPAPSSYSPISGDVQKAKTQQERVLNHMADDGIITDEESSKALSEALVFSERKDMAQDHAHHFTMMVMEELKKRYGEERVTRSGFEVTTSLDLGWQKTAEKNVADRVRELSAQGATNASLVAIDPRNGEIRALVGSANWGDPTNGKVNMALSPRQPGSSFKPIYYAEAIDKKVINAATILKDEPITFKDNYRPENYDFKYRGDIAVRKALALSLNIPAIEVMQKLGVEEAAAAAQRFGLAEVNEPDKYGLPLALGVAEVKLLDMTNAYATLANAGEQFQPTTIVSIKNKFDKTVFKHKPVAKRVTSQEAAYITSSILSDNHARAPTFGSSLNISNKTVAVKTGTTNDNKDAWTIGYTPSLSVGVWLGDNDSRAMSGVAGASGAGPIWKKSISAFLSNSPSENFSQPRGIVKLRVCRGDGLLATGKGGDTYEEYFIKDGGEPKGRCNSKGRVRSKTDEIKENNEIKEERREEKKEEGADEGGMGAGEPESTDATEPTTQPTDPDPSTEPPPEETSPAPA